MVLGRWPGADARKECAGGGAEPGVLDGQQEAAWCAGAQGQRGDAVVAVAEGQGGDDADAEAFADHCQQGGHVGDPAGWGERDVMLVVEPADDRLAAAG